MTREDTKLITKGLKKYFEVVALTEEEENEMFKKIMVKVKHRTLKCPHCENDLIPTSIEHEDGSGWMCGWTCNCDTIKDMEKKVEE